ncbi:MAG: preprotein translocase subunit SecE [Sedimentisphaerales bacterium]|nr:preprotein translocase subunit SecE [Sedimentisphaerales bacterium]
MFLEIYKRGQGKYTRLWSAFATAIIVVLGCLQLYKELEASSWNVSNKAAMWIVTLIPAGLFVILALLIFWLSNKHRVADFLIAAESEMKKVSWSSRQEIAVSTLIVIVVVIIMAILLGIADLCFQIFFSWLFR